MGPSTSASPRLEAALTVLVADDDEISRQVLRALLEQRGHAVVEAADGLEAIGLVSTVRPDLVLMDLEMPRLGGLEAARRVRAMSGGERTVPIHALSGHASPDDIERIAACGLDGHLPKPVDLGTLAAVLQAAAGRRGTAP